MDKKIRISFVYRDCLSLSEKSFFSYFHNFYFKALLRNDDIEINHVISDKKFDVEKLRGKTDAILIYENFDTGHCCLPEELVGIKKLSIPVISKVGDPWQAKNFDVKECHEKYKIDAYFGPWPTDFFYKYYPSYFKFKSILFGIEPSLYENVTPFKDRIKNRILNSGAVVNMKITNRLFQKLFRGDSDPMRHYKLRTICNRLPYIDYTSTLGHEYIGNKYPALLNKYTSAIAATSDTFTIKYFEIPAAACLTFMEITDRNYGKTLGFKDGETAIFINENNYREKFAEYLNDVDNPKWEEIAYAGRTFALENFTNDKGVESLVQLIKELI